MRLTTRSLACNSRRFVVYSAAISSHDFTDTEILNSYRSPEPPIIHLILHARNERKKGGSRLPLFLVLFRTKEQVA